MTGLIRVLGHTAPEEIRRQRIEAGRRELGLSGELISLIRADNARSIRLAERLGATRGDPIDLLGGSALVYRHAPS